MDYQIDPAAFMNALCSIEAPSLTVKRTWDSYYRGSTCAVWNYRLWLAVLAVDGINGDCIDRKEFEKLGGDNAYLLSQVDKVFNSLNSSSKSLQYSEFDCFLSLISFDEYDRLMETLSLKMPADPTTDLQICTERPSSNSSSEPKTPRKVISVSNTCLSWIRRRLRLLKEKWEAKIWKAS